MSVQNTHRPIVNNSPHLNQPALNQSFFSKLSTLFDEIFNSISNFFSTITSSPTALRDQISTTIPASAPIAPIQGIANRAGIAPINKDNEYRSLNIFYSIKSVDHLFKLVRTSIVAKNFESFKTLTNNNAFSFITTYRSYIPKTLLNLIVTTDGCLSSSKKIELMSYALTENDKELFSSLFESKPSIPSYLMTIMESKSKENGWDFNFSDLKS